ncbi:MAG TPA: c-type cytochrome [Thermoanaerobaculia bacterium]|nr:c-type cytochrome [Thermoanaerobaculia bacterium]
MKRPKLGGRRLVKAGAALTGLGLLAFLGVTSGVVSVRARPGHWPVTEAFLQYAKTRSVATHSLAVPPPPDLTDPALVLRGAGHFVTGCQPCHGGPGLHHPPIARAMTPHPPYLPEEVPDWKPRELFYMVKHGLKLTGMPAWPSEKRDDEVWAMVAFLLTLPGLDSDAYRALAYGETLEVPRGTVPERVLESCARCHGLDGNGRGTGAFPKLAGQRPAYLAAALEAYAEGERHSGIMGPVAAGLGAGEIRALARYYAERPGASSAAPADTAPPAAGASLAASRPVAAPALGVAEAIARGERIAAAGIPAEKIPACSHCHGPTETPRNPHYPDLAGQYPGYLVLQLELFQQDLRGGSPYARLMRPIADKLDPEQMRDVALYYGSLGDRRAAESISQSWRTPPRR